MLATDKEVGENTQRRQSTATGLIHGRHQVAPTHDVHADAEPEIPEEERT